MSWEYDFVALAADLFDLFVRGILPTVALIIFLVYFKRIVQVWTETRTVKRKVRAKKQQQSKTSR